MDPEELESRVRATQQTLAFSQTQTGAGECCYVQFLLQTIFHLPALQGEVSYPFLLLRKR